MNAVLDDVIADLDEAAKLMPDLDEALKSKPDSADTLKLKFESGEAVALRGEIIWLKAMQSAVRRGLSTIQDFQKDEEYTKNTAEARDLLKNYISSYGTHADVAFTLAKMLGEQFRLSGQANTSLLDSAIKNLEDAVEVSPDDPAKSNLIERLGATYINNSHPEQAEQLFQSFVVKRPEQPEVYLQYVCGKIPL